MESLTQFESRKQDHLRLALDPRVQTGGNGLDRIELIHEALPEINFADIDIATQFNVKLINVKLKDDSHKIKLNSPLFISSMTAGHEPGAPINQALAQLSSRRKILMGVGSQRRELGDPSARDEWRKLREQAPDAILAGNLGLAQLIQTPVDAVRGLVDSLQAVALFIHLNSLQEALQPEGTPNFRGGLQKIEELCRTLPVPVIIKEVGCGFSESTLKRLEGLGVFAVDISGYGGTHWGRIEGLRAPENSVQAQAAVTFSHWGTSTLQSMLNVSKANVTYQIFASGGVRHGLEAAKLVALGAELVGLAQPWLAAYGQFDKDPQKGLEHLADRLDFELKTALFCTGCKDLSELRRKKVWKWRHEI
jgi:isopentenyl-diphosphate delta-isomerase